MTWFFLACELEHTGCISHSMTAIWLKGFTESSSDTKGGAAAGEPVFLSYANWMEIIDKLFMKVKFIFQMW